MFDAIRNIFSMDKVVDHVSKGVDKAFYTDEERSDAWQLALAMYEPFKLAQRFLTLGLLFVLSSSLFLAVLIRVLGNIFLLPDNVLAGEIFWWVEDSKWLITESFTMFGEPFLYCCIFYTGGGAGEGIVKGIVNRRNAAKAISKHM